MKSYWAILSARFRTLLQYRAAAVAGFGTQLFWGIIRVMIFGAFYRSTTSPQPMTYSEVVTYVWLGQALIRMLPWSADPDIRTMIRSGNVAYELLRPLDLYKFWYSRALANLTAPTVLRSLPMFIVAGLFLGMQPPASWASAGAWIAATLSALLLGCAISALLSISLFWTISGEGISQFVSTAVWFLSGMIIPLPLFPDWAQTILNFLPFRGLMDTPFRLYLGHIPPAQVVPALAHQFAWTVALIALGRWVLARGTRRLVVQGG